jgi:hypothetical protein
MVASLPVVSLDKRRLRSRRRRGRYACLFYDAALSALGLQRCSTGDPDWHRTWAGWGTYQNGGAREIALWVCPPFNEQAAALAHGGLSEGAPGLRPQYNPDFYAAYVRDPDGNKFAAVRRGFIESQ